MKIIIQRVTHAKVSSEGAVLGEIGPGYMILFGVGEGDAEKEATFLADKIVKLRIMNDEQKKMNRSILEAGGEILVVSQFSLYADTSGGRRPSFIKAAKPEISKPLYELFISELKRLGVKKVATGQFGAYMDVEIHNDGPVTIILDSKE